MGIFPGPGKQKTGYLAETPCRTPDNLATLQRLNFRKHGKQNNHTLRHSLPDHRGGMICARLAARGGRKRRGRTGPDRAGSMTPDLLREHIRKCRAATGKPFGVNVPLMYRYAEQIMQVVMEERVPAVFTSAGSPKTWTGQLHAAGCKVAHVVSSTKFALKSQEAGVDAGRRRGIRSGRAQRPRGDGDNGAGSAGASSDYDSADRGGGIATGRGMLARSRWEPRAFRWAPPSRCPKRVRPATPSNGSASGWKRAARCWR